ncbi:MAG: hypothetical protein [Microvirus sp.]|nr:MAG: hypothetical protein [Microvirus sp.]
MSNDAAFCMLFASIVAMRFHPGYMKAGMDVPTLESCADIAEECLSIFRERCPYVED